MLQSIDYIYNAQGWLTRINDDLGGTNVPLVQCQTAPSMTNPGTAPGTPDLNDLFYLELKYDALFTGMTSGEAIQKNGNIAQMMWRVPPSALAYGGGARGRDRPCSAIAGFAKAMQAYGFSYDYLDRLTAARYYDVPTAGPTLNNRFNETLTYADKRGNFSNLQRNGGTYSGSCWTFGAIDNLTYTYHSGTNKIKTIADGTGNAKGFTPGPGGDYTTMRMLFARS